LENVSYVRKKGLKQPVVPLPNKVAARIGIVMKATVRFPSWD